MGSISGRHMSSVYCKIRGSHWWPGAEFPVLLICLPDTRGSDWDKELSGLCTDRGPHAGRATHGPVHQHGQFTTTACARVHRLRHRHTSTNTQTHTCTCIYTQKHTHKHRDTHTDTYVDSQRHTHIYTPLLKQMHTSKPCVNLCQGRAPHIAKDGDKRIAWEVKAGRVPGHSGPWWETIFQK